MTYLNSKVTLSLYIYLYNIIVIVTVTFSSHQTRGLGCHITIFHCTWRFCRFFFQSGRHPLLEQTYFLLLFTILFCYFIMSVCVSHVFLLNMSSQVEGFPFIPRKLVFSVARAYGDMHSI